MIMQIFVERSGNYVFDGCFHSMGRETRADPFPETCRSSTKLWWTIGEL